MNSLPKRHLRPWAGIERARAAPGPGREMQPQPLQLIAPDGIDPAHLGVIFLVNLERGFLQPLVGVNLFLASNDSLAAGAAGLLAR
jgi:hypothetical protein